MSSAGVKGSTVRVTRARSSVAATGCQYTPSAVTVTSGTSDSRVSATPCDAAPSSAIGRTS
ncbi:Uncharacterised protein [Mycobacterium tuberculosis]|uniref:Uncharacterized protein n=1 Tax=Mycobacterium tuberculosis TaxID=1773 RepID=A0A654ZST7_MYCTX|nr:Uncharacterised protein [Mycobacterium tuberculosis]